MKDVWECYLNSAGCTDEPCATVDQQRPKGDAGTDIVNLVKEDLEKRAVLGENRYGERLHPFNGRRAIVDAYQEVLDLAIYLRQVIFEEEKKIA